jgi:hypothetical protein
LTRLDCPANSQQLTLAHSPECHHSGRFYGNQQIFLSLFSPKTHILKKFSKYEFLG